MSSWMRMAIDDNQKQTTRNSSQHPIKRLIVRSHVDSNPRDRVVECVYPFRNLADDVVAVLPKHLSNLMAIGTFETPISRLRDFARSHDKTSYVILKRSRGAPVIFFEVFMDTNKKKRDVFSSHRDLSAWQMFVEYIHTTCTLMCFVCDLDSATFSICLKVISQELGRSYNADSLYIHLIRKYETEDHYVVWVWWHLKSLATRLYIQ